MGGTRGEPVSVHCTGTCMCGIHTGGQEQSRFHLASLFGFLTAMYFLHYICTQRSKGFTSYTEKNTLIKILLISASKIEILYKTSSLPEVIKVI